MPDRPRDSANNLRFLIGIRHEIEHQMTFRLDNNLSAKFQAVLPELQRLRQENYSVKKPGFDSTFPSVCSFPQSQAKKTGGLCLAREDCAPT